MGANEPTAEAGPHVHPTSEVTGLDAVLAAKAAASHSHAGLPVVQAVAADVVQSSNVTFTNLFTKAMLANEKWQFEAVVYFTAAAATTGLVVAVDAPPSPANVIYALDVRESATASRALAATTAGTALVGTASAAATILPAYVTGLVEAGATPGNVVVKFRSEVNTSAVTVKRGSHARWLQV